MNDEKVVCNELKDVIWKYCIDRHLPPPSDYKAVLEELIEDSNKLFLIESQLRGLIDDNLFENNRELYFAINDIWDSI